ncbi:MAG: transglutaminase family protein [Steroidobacteraceae bacterium]
MFRLHILHRTVYRYAAPVQFGRHRLVLRPREGHDLRIVTMDLAIHPGHRVTWARDVHGNSLALVDFEGRADQLEILNDVTIERHKPVSATRLPQPTVINWPVQYPAEELTIVNAYRALSFPDEAAPVQSWLQERLPRRGDDAHGMLLDLCVLLHRTISYRRRTEKGVQSPLQTIEAASGSCRDMATLMMDAARLLGVASRFASGYLHGSASQAGRASTHAWTELYLPALGWRGFDPTIGAETGLQHIATGVSQHPRGVMPVSGSYSGPGALLGMEVEVTTRELTESAVTQGL